MSKNDSLSLLQKRRELNHLFSYLDFLTPLENDIGRENIYLSMNTIRKYGYKKYQKILHNRVKYVFEGERTKCYIQKDQKEYGKNFDLQEIHGLKVMTWNVHNWVQTCTIGDNHLPKRRVEEFVKFIQQYNPDVICLQEVVPKNREAIEKNLSQSTNIKKLNFHYISSLFESYGYKYNVVANANVDASHMFNQTESYFYLGNAIFSKIPIEKYYLFGIPYNRNIMIIKIKYQNRYVYICNTHLEYNLTELKESYSKYELYQQLSKEEKKDPFRLNMNILFALLQKIRSKNVIICGDFNHSYSGNYKSLRLRMAKNTFIPFMKIYKDSTIDPPIFKRVTNLKNPQRFTSDFIFVDKSSSLQVEKSYVLYSDLSDHYPVYTSFQWKS